MATRPALLIAAALALLPAEVRAGAAETDPARRSLVVEAIERESPAVANISAEQVIVQRESPFPFPADPFFDEFFRNFRDSRPRRSTRTSLGSGVIVDADGTILTNAHVILRGSRVHVTLADGREFEAELVGADADTDIAVLRVKADGRLPTATLGTSRDLLIGETVIAIGNPFGLSHTVTTGVVSAIGRTLQGEDRSYADFIQTDASINPGNSGGPLLDIRGEVVGINAAIYAKGQGIGFAIPIDRARRVLRDLVSYGEVRRSWVGVFVQDLTPEVARHFGVRKGVIVTTVEPASPAARAGLGRGDVITQVDGHDVASRDEFEARVEDRGTGQALALTLRRENAEDAEVTLTTTAFPDSDADDLLWRLLGFAAVPADGGLAVAKVRAGGPMARIGLRRGDRILGLGGAAVKTAADLRRKMIELRGARGVVVTVGRGPYEYNVQVTLERG